MAKDATQRKREQRERDKQTEEQRLARLLARSIKVDLFKATDAKLQALRQQACLNLRSDQVNDELFRDSEFFDPRDLVQVKYEMLRRVQKRRAPGQPGGGNLRLFPAFVLSGAGSLRTGGAGRPDSSQTRTQAGSQTDSGGRRLHSAKASRGSFAANSGDSGLDRRAIPDRGSSPQYRTRSGATSKKTAKVGMTEAASYHAARRW